MYQGARTQASEFDRIELNSATTTTTNTPPSANYDSTGTRTALIYAVLTAGSALTTLVVVLRCYCRAYILRWIGADDRAMVLAETLLLGLAVAQAIEAKHGLGMHEAAIAPSMRVAQFQAYYATTLTYTPAAAATKVAILLQYQRIFASVTLLRRMCCVMLVFLLAWGATTFFLAMLICVPVPRLWDKSVSGRCLDGLKVWYVVGAVNMATDVLVFGMPLPVVRTLMMPLRQKLSLLVVFGIGFFTCAVSLIRITTLREAVLSPDRSWTNVDAALWSFVEVATGILASCLPTLRPLLRRVLPWLFGSQIAGASDDTGPNVRRSRARRAIVNEDAELEGLGMQTGDPGGTSSNTVAGSNEAQEREREQELEGKERGGAPPREEQGLGGGVEHEDSEENFLKRDLLLRAQERNSARRESQDADFPD